VRWPQFIYGCLSWTDVVHVRQAGRLRPADAFAQARPAFRFADPSISIAAISSTVRSRSASRGGRRRGRVRNVTVIGSDPQTLSHLRGVEVPGRRLPPPELLVVEATVACNSPSLPLLLG